MSGSTSRGWMAFAVALTLIAVGAVWKMSRSSSVPQQVVSGSDDPQLGRRTYVNCQACHGINGQGIPGYAPSLVGTPGVLGDARPLVLRIVAGGASSGRFSSVMPGFSRFSDVEVAAVATYVRSSWGNAAAHVTAADVAAIRAPASP